MSGPIERHAKRLATRRRAERAGDLVEILTSPPGTAAGATPRQSGYLASRWAAGDPGGAEERPGTGPFKPASPAGVKAAVAAVPADATARVSNDAEYAAGVEGRTGFAKLAVQALGAK